MNGQEQALCNQVWLAQNWVHETVRAFTRRFGDQLARQLRTAEALQVSALILHRSGAGVVLQSEEVWQMLPREWEARRLVLLKKWRDICQQDTKTAKGHGAKPFGSYKPAAFLQKVLDLRESLRQLDKADDSQMWHHEAALVLMSKGFEYLHQLDGLQRRDIARWSDNQRVQSLLSLAVTVINESAESKRQKRHHELVSSQVAALSAADVADQSRKVAVQNPAWQSGGPRDQIAALRHMDEESRLLVLEARAAELKTQTQRKSLPSVASGLRCWHSFANQVLQYRDEETLPPKCARHVVQFVGIFRHPGTARNYVSYLRWACAFHRLDTSWCDQEVQMVIRGLEKSHVASISGQLSDRPLLTEQLVALLVQQCSRTVGLEQLGDLFVVAWQFLLRVPSEGFPIQFASQEDLLCLPEGRHSALVVDENFCTQLRLRTRKNRPRGSLLMRPCCCKSSVLNPLCVGHRLRERSSRFYTGERLTATSPSEGLKVLHKVLADLGVAGPSRYTWKAFRAGKATSMIAQGHTLPQVLSAGEWRSLAVLKYVDEDVIENAAFLRAIDSDEDA